MIAPTIPRLRQVQYFHATYHFLGGITFLPQRHEIHFESRPDRSFRGPNYARIRAIMSVGDHEDRFGSFVGFDHTRKFCWEPR